jgi:hypothetical protein
MHKTVKTIWVVYSVLLVLVTGGLLLDYLVTKEYTIGTGLPGKLYFDEQARANEINGLLTYFGAVLVYVVGSFWVSTTKSKGND